MKRIVDYKAVEMTDEEFEYYNQIIKEFTIGTYNGREMFHDVFETDENGIISIIRPPLKKEIAWAAILFLQNLMINQRLRQMEDWIKKITNEK